MDRKMADYNAGIEFALRVAQKGGIEALSVKLSTEAHITA